MPRMARRNWFLMCRFVSFKARSVVVFKVELLCVSHLKAKNEQVWFRILMIGICCVAAYQE